VISSLKSALALEFVWGSESEGFYLLALGFVTVIDKRRLY